MILFYFEVIVFRPFKKTKWFWSYNFYEGQRYAQVVVNPLLTEDLEFTSDKLNVFS